MGFYFIFCVITYYCIIYFVALIFPALAIGSSFRSAPVSLWTLPYFLAIQNAPASSCVCPVPAVELFLSSRSSDSFYWKVLLETKIWVRGLIIGTGVSWLLGQSSKDRAGKYMYEYEPMFTHVSIVITVSIHVLSLTWVRTHVSNSNPYHKFHSRLLLCLSVIFHIKSEKTGSYHLLLCICSIPAYTYSSFRILNLYYCEKQLYQQYSVYVKFPLSLFILILFYSPFLSPMFSAVSVSFLMFPY